MPLISPDSVEAVRQRADLVELVRGRVDLVRRGGRWWGQVPVPRGALPLVLASSRPTSAGTTATAATPPATRSTGAQSAGGRRRLRRGDRGARRAVRHPASSIETRSPGDGRAREAAEQAGGTCSTARRPSSRSTSGRRTRPPRPATTSPAGASTRPSCGASASATPPAAGRSLAGAGARGGLLARPAGRRRARAAARRRRPPTSSPRASCSRSPTPRGGSRASAARTLDPAERAKYVNSPEGRHFRKRTLLFGLAEARAAAARSSFFVVGEGYTDVMGLVAAGVECAVACMGTSLTAEQIAPAAAGRRRSSSASTPTRRARRPPGGASRPRRT